MSLADDDDNEPHADLIEAAANVLNDENATEQQQRAAAARIKRLRGRRLELGVSVFDFAAVPGKALRIYYSPDTLRSDPQGDAELAAMFADPLNFDNRNLPRLVQLLNSRPYCLVKANQSPGAVRPDGSVAFHMMRRAKFNRTNLPFEEGDAVVLFDDLDGRPVFRGRITAVALSEDQVNPASGGLAIELHAVR